MAKKKQNIVRNIKVRLIFSYLILFPFGQILNVRIGSIKAHPIDVLVFLSLPLYFIRPIPNPSYLKYFKYFLAACIFSLILSLNLYPLSEILIGGLYLLRLSSYLAFSAIIFDLVDNKSISMKVIRKSLLIISLATALLGIIQYFWIPNLTTLRFLDWDDHLGRLAGTFLDPGFIGLIIVFGLLTSIHYFLKGKIYVIVFFILFISLLLTYSRASYLSFIAGLIYLVFRKFDKLMVASVIFFFILFIPLLPIQKSEGVRILRTASIQARIENYKESFMIINKNPLFGVGFNNICSARLRLIGGKYPSNSCYGADSSLLFIIATTGIVGLLLFIKSGFEIWKNILGDSFGTVSKSIIIALLIHSLFSNSLFYPWVMGYLGLLFSATMKKI